ncbi:methyl-accepting chemotaxis protein [Marinisporobacter balticus]|uniref:Cache domain-containing protein n=1 Tax=Marinisporobacter balticus TaxID=2018667 RepID=A0A4R2KSU9_9FIRM|nr:hypothetical protein [Marinisporobacter balticus]TCO76853.1 cache domain-containing protein [Marinisporobacter balticus]
MKSLKSKMMAVIIPMVILAIGSISIFSYYFAKNIIVKNANEILIQTSQAYANKIDGWLTMHLEMIDSVKEAVEKSALAPDAELDYLKHMVNKFDNVSDLYIGTVDGQMIDGAGWIPPDDYDPRQRPWYQEGMNKDKINFSKPFLDKVTKEMVVGAVVQIDHYDGTKRGVFSGDVSLFVDELVTEFSATSEELLASLENVLAAIEGVALAANEGAEGTTDIANRICDTNDKANEVRTIVTKTKKSAEKLKVEIDRFKI